MNDTELHSWEVLAEIIAGPVCKHMLSTSAWVLGTRTSSTIATSCLCTYRKVFAIRAKRALADDGLYRDARMLYDGSNMIIQNGEVFAQWSHFSLLPVEVIVVTVDLDRVRSYRTSASRNVQAANSPRTLVYSAIYSESLQRGGPFLLITGR